MHWKSLIHYSIITILTIISIPTNAQVDFQTPSININYCQSSPKKEVRAVWLTTIGGLDWPHSYSQTNRSMICQKQELCEILDKLQRAGINTVLLQTRIRGTVIYPSMFEPWDGCLSGVPGKSPGYDALEFAINECHIRGMELHAWIVTMPIGKWNALGCKQLRKRHSRIIKKIDTDGYMNPEDNETADYIAKICEEITRNYDIDGIHLDYIRYPENWILRVSHERARDYITKIVRDVHDAVKSYKPWVKISCSPIGKYKDVSRYWSHGWNAYEKVNQDAQGWLKSGLMDELFPMMYFKGDQFYPFAIDWSENTFGRIVAPGLGIYFMSPEEGNWPFDTIRQEMYILRQFNLGHAYYRSKFLTDNLKGVYNFAAKDFDSAPAIVPAMTWLNKKGPDAPTRLLNDSTASTLSWMDAKNNNDSPYLTYNIYSSCTWPVDISKSENLILQRLKTNKIKVDLRHGRYYAITAMDRYGNESIPAQNYIPKPKPIITRQEIMTCVNNNVKLSGLIDIDTPEYISVETLQGSIISILKPHAGYINVKTIDNGFYILRAINKKGKNHRLGFFYKMP